MSIRVLSAGSIPSDLIEHRYCSVQQTAAMLELIDSSRGTISVCVLIPWTTVLGYTQGHGGHTYFAQG